MAPIHYAADKADVNELRSLLESGASAQAQDDHYGHTPLHKLFTWDKKNERGEDHIACFELLLRYGADVNATAQDGATALNYLRAPAPRQAHADVDAPTRTVVTAPAPPDRDHPEGRLLRVSRGVLLEK